MIFSEEALCRYCITLHYTILSFWSSVIDNLKSVPSLIGYLCLDIRKSVNFKKIEYHLALDIVLCIRNRDGFILIGQVLYSQMHIYHLIDWLIILTMYSAPVNVIAAHCHVVSSLLYVTLGCHWAQCYVELMKWPSQSMWG